METIDTRLVAGGSLEPGVGWYRKCFDVPKEWEGKRIFLSFEGIYRDSIAFLNHYDIGSHQSGYTGAVYEITDYLNYGGENLLAVRVDASEREGWWYEGGGIYRDVEIIVTEPVHFEFDGTFVRNSDLHTVIVTTEFVNQSLDAVDAQITVEIIDPSGKRVATAQKRSKIGVWKKKTVEFELHLDEVCLWDLENPQLYQARLFLTTGEEKTNELLENITVPFGIREIRFDVNNGFFLNGKSVKIKGVC